MKKAENVKVFRGLEKESRISEGMLRSVSGGRRDVNGMPPFGGRRPDPAVRAGNPPAGAGAGTPPAGERRGPFAWKWGDDWGDEGYWG